MLDVYKAKLRDKPLITIDLHIGDMTNFDLHSQFDSVIFPFRVFQVLQNEEDRMSCLKCTSKHMKADSSCIICMFNPHPEIIKNWGKKGIIDFDVPIAQENCNLRRISNQIKHDESEQVIVVENIYQKHINGKVFEEFPDRLELGYLYPDQARALFTKANFKIEAEYGYWDFSQFKTDEFREQIYILKKLQN